MPETLKDKLRYWREHGLQVSPRATPNRRNNIAPRQPNNSYEKGVPTDKRGMPYLDPKTLEPIGQRRYDREKRTIDEAKHRLGIKE